MKMKPVVYNIN